MSDVPAQTMERLLQDYFRAKDENRPHLLSNVFAPDATLEMVVKTGAISFPPITHGRASITDVLVRKFGQTYENVYSFYLGRPPPRANTFSCDWLVGMSEKATGSVRIGCGRYDWHFQSQAPGLVDRLGITIEVMAQFPAASLDVLVDWLARLPRPWCEASAVVRSAPAVAGLDPVLNRIGRSS